MAEPFAGVAPISPGWLRSPEYDLTLIRSTAVLALLTGSLVAAYPKLLGPVMFVNLWLLAYHHVISTYTRLIFDRESLNQHRFLVFVLPIIVLSAIFLVGWQIGWWVIPTAYFYTQWFHYTRQSWGISKAYAKKSGGLVDGDSIWTALTFYLVPLYGILYRSWQAPEGFLFQDFRVIPVPELLVDVVGFAALVSVVAWVVSQLDAWRRGQLAQAHCYYMLTHFVIFFVGYRFIADVSHGWLVLNIWHNAQYILFVWLFNTNRYKNGVQQSARFISWLSQPSNKLTYFGVCVAISTGFYVAISVGVGVDVLSGLPAAILIYQGINFHHYVVDAVIWKMRKAPMRETLGLDQD